jgi:hypothetical protein
MLFGSALFLRTLFRGVLLLWMSLRGVLFLRMLCRVRCPRGFRPALGNVLGRPALRRRRMFVMLRDGRKRKQNANRNKSKYDFHPFQPSTIRVSEVFEEWMIAR